MPILDDSLAINQPCPADEFRKKFGHLRGASAANISNRQAVERSPRSHFRLFESSVPMMLELTILLVLLAWMLGNTLMRASYLRAAGSVVESLCNHYAVATLRVGTARLTSCVCAPSLLRYRELQSALIEARGSVTAGSCAVHIVALDRLARVRLMAMASGFGDRSVLDKRRYV